MLYPLDETHTRGLIPPGGDLATWFDKIGSSHLLFTVFVARAYHKGTVDPICICDATLWPTRHWPLVELVCDLASSKSSSTAKGGTERTRDGLEMGKVSATKKTF